MFQRGLLWVDLNRVVFGSDRADEKTEKENRKGDKKQILTRTQIEEEEFPTSKSYSQKKNFIYQKVFFTNNKPLFIKTNFFFTKKKLIINLAYGGKSGENHVR